MVNPTSKKLLKEIPNKKSVNSINKYPKDPGSKSKHKHSRVDESPLRYVNNINIRSENESMDGSNLLNQFIRH